MSSPSFMQYPMKLISLTLSLVTAFKTITILYFVIALLVSDALGFEILYNVDFSKNIVCDNLFTIGKWTPVVEQFSQGGSCSYKCSTSQGSINLFSPDTKKFRQGVQVQSSIPTKYYSFIYVDMLYFQTLKDIDINLFDKQTLISSKTLSSSANDPSLQEMAYTAKCSASFVSSDVTAIQKESLEVRNKLSTNAFLTYRIFQEQNGLNTQWYGLFKLRIYSNCVENCQDCISDTTCSKCMYGFDLVKTANNQSVCTQTGVCQQKLANCLTCSIGSDGTTQCITCLPGYTLDTPSSCLVNPNSKICPANQYYSACDDTCKQYSKSCFINNFDSLDAWTTCNQSTPNLESFKCPATKQILIYSIKNYSVYNCGCSIPFCDICSSTTGCNRCFVGYNYDSVNKQCVFQDCPLFYNKSTSLKCVLNYTGDNKELIELNTSKLTCLKCFSVNCQECVDDGPTSCKTCKTGYFMYKGQCIKNCPRINQYNASNQCFNCDDINCDSCSGWYSSDCTKCNSSTFLDKGKCVAQCNNNQYDVNRNCFECADILNCLSCSSNLAGACLKCSPSTFLKAGQCVSSCGQGYFEMSIDGGVQKICKSCFDKVNCLYCQNEQETSCIQCANTTFIDNGKCVFSCKNNQFTIATRKCYQCSDANCDYCSDIGEFSCQKCSSSTYLDQTGKCVVQCPKNLYDVNKKCFDCYDSTNCLKCSNTSIGSCTQCVANINLVSGECKLPCSNGQYQKPDLSCGNCYDTLNCITCTSEVNDGCSKCKSSFYLENGMCVNACAGNLYTNQNVCYSCYDPNCEICPNTLENTCTKCNSSTFLFKGKCVNQCDKKQYDTQRTCFECYDQLNCINCSSSDYNGCVECNQNQVVKDGICTQMCGLGYFIDESQLSQIDPSNMQRLCKKCFDYGNCLECTDANDGSCILCSSQTFLQNGKCVQKCDQEKQYDSSRTCYQCFDTNCVNCSSSNKEDCQKCNPGKYLNKDGTCINQCFQNQFDQDDKCFDCFDKQNCLKCSSDQEDTCQKCNTDHAEKEGKCVLQSDCGVGYYIEVDNQQYKRCIKCNDFGNCKKCKDDKASSCINCVENKYLNNGKCVDKCLNDQYDANRNCYECFDPRCSFCTSEAQNACRICKDNFQFGGICIDRCDKDQFDENNNCFECFDKLNCTKCSTQQEGQCVQCLPGKKLLKGNCVDSCSSNYFTDTLSNGSVQCLGCSSYNVINSFQCFECYNLSNCSQCDRQSKCTLCNKGWKLKNGVCVQECGPSFIEITDNQNQTVKCVACFDRDKCLICEDNQEGKCNQCSQGNYLLNGVCLSSCPNNYGPVEIQQQNQCVLCKDQNCLTCQNSYSECLTCKMYYKLDQNNSCTEDVQLDYKLEIKNGEDNSFYIEFSQAIEGLANLANEILTIKLNIQKAYQDQYNYKYIVNGDRNVMVQFNFVKPYAGHQNVQVQFKKKQLKFNCNSPTKEIEVSFCQNVDTQTLAATQAISSANVAASQVAVNSILPLAFSGQFAFIATVVDITEILQLMEFTQSMQPWNTKIFYVSLQKFNIPFWNVFQLMQNFDKINQEAPGKFQEDSSISATFFRQAGEHFTIALICVFANLFNLFLLNAFKHTEKAMKVLNKLNQLINPIRLTSEVLWTVYYDICLGFFLQLTNMSSDKKYPEEEGINYTVTFLSVLIIFLPVIVAYWIKKGTHHQITETFTEGMSSKYFWVFFYIRRLYCVFVVVLFQFSGYAQITLLTMFHIAHLILSVHYKPYETKSQNIRNYLQAFLLIVGTVMMYPLVEYEKHTDEQQINFGWSQCVPFITIIAIELLYFVTSLMLSVYSFIIKSYKYFKARKQTKPINLQSPAEPQNKITRFNDKNFKQKQIQNKIDEVDEEDSYTNHPPLGNRKQTVDLVLRNTQVEDPLGRLPTYCGEDLRTKQLSTNNPTHRTKFNFQTEESQQSSPKKSSQQNFTLESPNAGTNSLFIQNRTQLFSPKRRRGRTLIKSSLSEIEIGEYYNEIDQVRGKADSQTIKINIAGDNYNQNVLGSQSNNSELYDDSQISPIKLENQRLTSPSMSRIGISNVSIIKSSEYMPREREKTRTILLNKIDDAENEEETPISTPINIPSPDIQHYKQELKTFSVQLQENEDNKIIPEQQRNSPKLRKRISRLQSFIKNTKKNNNGLINKDIQVIDLNQNTNNEQQL